MEKLLNEEQMEYIVEKIKTRFVDKNLVEKKAHLEALGHELINVENAIHLLNLDLKLYNENPKWLRAEFEYQLTPEYADAMKKANIKKMEVDLDSARKQLEVTLKEIEVLKNMIEEEQ